MTKYKLEYIWLDGKKPVPCLRGKSLLKSFENPPTLAEIPNWGFDGSSTMQAEGKSSDCVLKPVALYPDGARTNGYIVLSEVMHADGTHQHLVNTGLQGVVDLAWGTAPLARATAAGRPSRAARAPRPGAAEAHKTQPRRG